MDTFVVSDLHLGSKHCLYEPFISFVRSLPEGATLVLNGDTVDRWHREFPGRQQEVLELLVRESLRRPVVWVRGNHDRRLVLPDEGRIDFRPFFNVGRRLFIAHGHRFESLRHYSRVFVILFRFLHFARVLFGAESVHVARYAKRFPLLYGTLRRHVRRNAVRHAKANKYEAVTCGHTHHMEECTLDGVRYFNTGAWTEMPIVYLHVPDTGAVTLVPIPKAVNDVAAA